MQNWPICGRQRPWPVFDRIPSRVGTSPRYPGPGRNTVDVMIPRVGDVLRVSCPQAPTDVTKVGRFYVPVRSPWRRIDPDVSWTRWNGDIALCGPVPPGLVALRLLAGAGARSRSGIRKAV